MEKITKDYSLRDKEKWIISLKNTYYLDAFTFVHKYYRINYKLRKSSHYLVFQAIYIDKLKLPAWQLANYCKIAESTLFRLRNEIIECFYSYLEDEVISEEVAVTKV